MLRDDAVVRIQQRLAFRSDRTSEIVNALIDAQQVLESELILPWFLQSEVSMISTVSGEERVPLPGDFIQEWEDDPLWYFNGSATDPQDAWVPLAKEDLEYLRETLPGSGSPLAYQLDTSYFRIFPTPDDTYTLKMIYYKQDDTLETNIENKWLFHIPQLLIGIAGKEIATGLRDNEAAAAFTALETEHRQKLFLKNEARRHSSRRYIMGGPD